MAEENNVAHVYYSGKFRQRKTKLCHKVKVEAVLIFKQTQIVYLPLNLQQERLTGCLEGSPLRRLC